MNSVGATNRTVPAAQFRQQCLRLMDEVQATGDALTITKHGRPVVAVVPISGDRSASIIGWSADIRIDADLSEPAIPPQDWHVVSAPEDV